MSCKIIAVSGSARTGSYNSLALAIAVEAARQAGAEVTVIELGKLNIPILNQDEEAKFGMPADARHLKEQITAADGLLVACPEYNATLPPLFSNHFIHWPTRPAPGSLSLAFTSDAPIKLHPTAAERAFMGKPVALMAASPSAYGGARVLVELRRVFEAIGTRPLPPDAQGEVVVPKAHEVFTADGSCSDPKIRAHIEELARRLVDAIKSRTN